MKKTLAVSIGTVFMAVILTAGVALAKEVKAERILWEHAGDLAPAFGYEENIGSAGMLSGLSNGYVVVGGGANFPNGGPLVGGPKVCYPDLYVFKAQQGALVQTDHGKMPFEIAYGASVTAPEGVYYIGGSTAEDGAKAISLLTVNARGKVVVKEVGALPFSFQNGVAALYDGALYIGLGKQDGKLSTDFYRYDLKAKTIAPIAPFPGEAREQSVAQVLDGKLCVFSGGSAIAYTDGYRYDFASGAWAKAASVGVNGKAVSLLGANSVKLNADEMLVIGGFDKAVYDDAVARLSTLKGDALASFKAGYFGADPAALHWNKEILIYQAKQDAWRTIGQVPFDAPCGEGLILAGAYIVSVNGEIKPGVRSNRMYIGTILPDRSINSYESSR